MKREVYVLHYYYWDSEAEYFYPYYIGCFNSIEQVVTCFYLDYYKIEDKLTDLFYEISEEELYNLKIFMPKEKIKDIDHLYFYANITEETLNFTISNLAPFS